MIYFRLFLFGKILFRCFTFVISPRNNIVTFQWLSAEFAKPLL